MVERVLVTGGNGRLGRHVMAALAGRCEATSLDIQAPPPGADWSWIDYSILDHSGLLEACRGQEAVIHLAGIDDGDAKAERDYFAVNVQGAWNLLQAAEDAELRRVVVASSSAAYGLGYDRSPDCLPVEEDHALHCTGTYGMSKEVIERVAAHYARRGQVSTVCLRPPLIVRPEKEQAILAQLALADPDRTAPPAPAAAGPAPYGALSASRSYIRSADAARAFAAALSYEETPFAVFNVAAEDGIGRPETLVRYENVYGRAPVVSDPDRYDKDPYSGAVSTARAKEKLDWAPEGDWRDVERSGL